MHLLYADESGSISDPKQRFFVLAGICVFERQGFWISEELDKVAAKFNPADPNSVELHASYMYHGKSFWKNFPAKERIEAMKEALEVFAKSHKLNTMFACILRKSIVRGDPVEYAFEQLSSRFDYFLRREHKRGNTQRGLLIFDKSTYETTLQNLATDFRKFGHTWGVLKNLAEVPLFIDSKASRLIQLADLVAYALFRHYEAGDNQFYDIISDRWDGDGGEIHGLYEKIK